MPGLYIVVDGIIGCGKSEQIRQLKKRLHLDFPDQQICFTYEPGGNAEADALRQKLKHEQLSAREEMELFAESRAITLPQVVAPVLREGGIVISDRSVTTSLAYQAFGRELGLEKVWEANKEAVGGIMPDLVIWMNVDLDSCLKRSGGEEPDKFDREAKEFWERTIPGFDRMLSFVQTISPETKAIVVNDPDGSIGIEPMRLIIREHLYPEINKFIATEGRILRDRQL